MAGTITCDADNCAHNDNGDCEAGGISLTLETYGTMQVVVCDNYEEGE